MKQREFEKWQSEILPDYQGYEKRRLVVKCNKNQHVHKQLSEFEQQDYNSSQC